MIIPWYLSLFVNPICCVRDKIGGSPLNTKNYRCVLWDGKEKGCEILTKAVVTLFIMDYVENRDIIAVNATVYKFIGALKPPCGPSL